MRILLVEDRLEFCQDVERVLSPMQDIDFLGYVHSMEAFHNTISSKTPDILLLDLDLENPWDGVDILEWLRPNHPSIKTIVFTANREEIAECYRLGAKGYVLKSKLGELYETIQEVDQGKIIVPPELGQELVQQMCFRSNTHDLMMELKEYTDREQEIIKMVGKGLSRDAISEELCISIFTIKRHIEKILKRAKLKTSVEVYEKFKDIL
jgi:DNA-binding NarL/FixJ family response regulator